MPTEEPSDITTDLSAGFQLLRNEALDAHLASDGTRVIHLCTVALSEINKRLKAAPGLKIPTADIRWCFTLALYWFIDRSVLFLLKPALKMLIDRNSDREHHQLIEIVVAFYDNPFEGFPTARVRELGTDWLAKCSEPDDISFLCLVIELCWLTAQSPSEWREILKLWRKADPIEPRLRDSLTQLDTRLVAQSRFARPNPAEISTAATDPHFGSSGSCVLTSDVSDKN